MQLSKQTSFEFETGMDLFPNIKAMFIKDNYYVVAVKSKNECLYADFIIMKDIVLNGFGYLSNKHYIKPKVDCFDSNKQPFEMVISGLTEKKLKQLYATISDKVNEDTDRMFWERHINNVEVSISEMRLHKQV